MIRYSFASDPHLYQMDFSSIPTILQHIEESTLQSVPIFFSHILDSKRKEYKASATAIKSPPGTHLIINSLLHASRPMVMEWAFNLCQDILSQEIIQVSDIKSGLHFNMSHACSADLMGFNLEDIIIKFQNITPLTWNLVKTLLDADTALRYHRQKYASKGVHRSRSGHDVVDDGGLGAGSGAQAMEGDDGSTDHSENDVLLHIVSNLLGNEEVTHVVC